MSDFPLMDEAKLNRKKIYKSALGLSFLVVSLILFLSFASFLSNWKEDQSQISNLADKAVLANNAFGKLGAWLGDFFIFKFAGISAFLIPLFLGFLGAKVLFGIKRVKILSILFNSLFFLLFIPILIGLLQPERLLWQGVLGFEMNEFLRSLIGVWGLGVLLTAVFLLYLILEWKITPDSLKREIREDDLEGESDDEFNLMETSNSENELEKPVETNSIQNISLEPILVHEKPENETILDVNYPSNNNPTKKPEETNIDFEVKTVEEEEVVSVKDSTNKKVEEFGEYDPRLELSKYQFPTLDLLKAYDSEGQITIDQKELENNKNRIVETLGNYGIKIAQIKATIGPTVTLYEIVPEAGVRISKIKNLEDDIALSLSALGIRIIAPIPGKGTIGIEVPNSHTSIVSMRSVISSQKFQNEKKMALPIAFGKTISNETFVVDLARMPHLLMAGATGQGKSVGLNAVIASLLYKKHPAELKFVFVDPKKVELTLYNKIERHFLAKLPDSDEPIITDNSKVINTLNSLCIEMDDRYELLKNAYVRNIKEYNQKFKERKLNPEKGHRFLPYIVLIVDEFADLIMTAGKEVELPIARLAQLARAIGIHLIIATQRPSVNVITGMIKANFPARVAFRVTSKIDSRTILDTSGADQLIGKGDMLLTTGNDLVRLQCAFVDTPEVEEITDFIGNQKGYPNAFLLPEYVGEESNSVDVNLDERDALFEDAARVLVLAQQGSASLLQRKLKLGYNRAGRLIDQLEAAGIVGPFEGSKARQVLVQDENSLEQLLNSLNG